MDPAWVDSDRIVVARQWVTPAELANIRHKPDSLAQVAFDPQATIMYDPLEPIVR